MPYSTAPARRLLLACTAACALSFACAPANSAPAAAEASATQAYDLKAQSLESAIQAVALRSGRTILAPSPLVAGKQAAPLRGDFTAAEAVRALLAGSGLDLIETDGALIVREAHGFRGASDEAAAPASTVAEVMVTGSRIRGGQQAAPVEVITRPDIEKTGYTEVGDVIRSLPEDFGGGQNPGIAPGASAGGPANQNFDNGSTINLRGIGSDATLVLIDGQRLSADGLFGAADVSVIPLQAISRIEVVTDGASALYGSDAVAGVVNFIPRKDYNGAELSETLGDSTRGGGFNQTYSGLAGGTWATGHALATVEYNHQEPIVADQRDFTSTAAPTDPILQGQNRLSVFANAGQDLTPWAIFNLDGLYSQRETGNNFRYAVGDPAEITVETVRSYFAAPSLTFELPGSWSAVLSGAASGTRSGANVQYAGVANDGITTNDANSVELSANGDAVTLPSGKVKLAVGAGFLAEDFDYAVTGEAPEPASRKVDYVFGEADIPLVHPDDTRFGLNRLDLTLAGRIEHYTDFGTTSNPKVGLRYEPTPGLALRATWGTSFKAPQFEEEAQPVAAYLYPALLLGGPPGLALLARGGNDHLRPERSKSWTVGFDWSPPQVRSLTISLTYFNIDYTDRIILPFGTEADALSNPTNAPFIITDPTAAQQAAVINAAPVLLNYSGQAYTPSQVVALLEGREINASAQLVDGVDLSIKKGFVLPLGALDTFASASWLHIQQQLAAGAPFETITGTLFNPPTAKVRAGLTWTYGGFSSTGVFNWVAGETDIGVTPNVPISAWTTVDLNLTYRFGRLAPQLPDLESTLAITNLFDRPPPFAGGAGVQGPGYFYDSTNVSAVGRFVSLSLRQRF